RLRQPAEDRTRPAATAVAHGLVVAGALSRGQRKVVSRRREGAHRVPGRLDHRGLGEHRQGVPFEGQRRSRHQCADHAAAAGAPVSGRGRAAAARGAHHGRHQRHRAQHRADVGAGFAEQRHGDVRDREGAEDSRGAGLGAAGVEVLVAPGGAAQGRGPGDEPMAARLREEDRCAIRGLRERLRGRKGRREARARAGRGASDRRGLRRHAADRRSGHCGCGAGAGVSARSLILALALGMSCNVVYAAATPPKPIETRAPEYPKEEEQAGHGGRVVLKFSVSDTGAIENVEVATSTGFPKLDEAALAAARTWKFEPAKDESGKAVAGERSMALSFKPPDPDPVFPETCADLNAKVAEYRAQNPQGELGKMDAFSATTGLFFLKSASKPMEVRLAMVKDLNAMYPGVAATCEAKPQAKYLDVVFEAFGK